MKKRTVQHLGYKCIGPNITEEKIKELQDDLKENGHLEELRNHFYALSGDLRLKILYLLHKEGELCVCDLADILQTTISAVSHQLRILRELNLVKIRRDAQTIFYTLNPSQFQRFFKLEFEEVVSV